MLDVLTKLLLSVTEKKQFYNNILMPWMNKQFAKQKILLFICQVLRQVQIQIHLFVQILNMDNSFVDILKKGGYLIKISLKI